MGEKNVSTALELLRSRYTAHVKCEIPYIISTVHPDKLEGHDEAVISKWAAESQWDGLEIIKTEKGTASDTEGSVEFIAKYREKLKKHTHHEVAKFVKKDGKWFFYDSDLPFKQVVNETPKVGRNDICPCGSGKKYKKCCG
ncbi:MAG: hypothetical protein A2355_07820 [Spirochaetes bacterium RIFOXYB1_FULL_32_8]|nr:MAG: hypothetical protein A2Y30_04980 [Spirochaetes bacterium GWE1_32_154]OHD76253.1 MAG: hypothetical protein A2355_07820 [Spirochaetes bacterium RIFOXYB1_FULL_32_8]HBD95211.1 zinc chelation protein SecC [Spirochaetia bacterium]HBI37575.1 zinc chelation protein SecC [Spirochaetia bacterium]